jgi:hypothetical protein
MSQIKSSLLVLASLAVASMAMITGCSTDVSDDGVSEDESALTGHACRQDGLSRECVPESDTKAAGAQYCLADDNNDLIWSECVITNNPCSDPTTCGSSSASTPLVLVFNDRAVEYTSEAGASFDLTGLGMSVANDWPTASTPWLAVDRDGSGSIEGGEELFGSATVLADGSRASNGFVALQALDSDKDGRITPNDAGWSTLLVWSDRDANRTSVSSELGSAASWSLLSIDLAYQSDARCDARGNCEIERASFRYTDASGREQTGSVVDVHLKTQSR